MLKVNGLNISAYLKKKYDALLVFTYSDFVDGATQCIEHFYMLTKDLKVMYAIINQQEINFCLYGVERLGVLDDLKQLEQKGGLMELSDRLEFEEIKGFQAIDFLQSIVNDNKDREGKHDIVAAIESKITALREEI